MMKFDDFLIFVFRFGFPDLIRGVGILNIIYAPILLILGPVVNSKAKDEVCS
jgi:hypothetical protein